MNIRKQANRDGYASLRGSMALATKKFGTLTGQITYGKIKFGSFAPVTSLKIEGGSALVGRGSTSFTGSFNGRADSTGSQVSGKLSLVFNGTTKSISNVTFR